MACEITEEATMLLLGQTPESPLSAAVRIFSAVIVSLALLVGISAHTRSSAEPKSSVTLKTLVSFCTDHHGFFLTGPSSKASDYRHET